VNTEPNDIIALGAIQAGIKKFDKIQKMTQIEPEELNSILEQLEKSMFIRVAEKNGLLGKKIEIIITKKGAIEVDNQIHELQTKWNQMSVLYKTQDKEELKQYIDDNKSFFPMMIFFGVMNIGMFSMMFGMIGMKMSNYVSTENMPEGEEFDTEVEF
jgi:DNA-binding HxlR family transcriptional regulator